MLVNHLQSIKLEVAGQSLSVGQSAHLGHFSSALHSSTLESAAKKAAEDRSGKGKPVRHQLHWTPTATQQARWEAVQQAGLSLRAIAKNLGMARDTVGKYLKAESPPTKKLSARERAKVWALARWESAAN